MIDQIKISIIIFFFPSTFALAIIWFASKKIFKYIYIYLFIYLYTNMYIKQEFKSALERKAI